jgi:hypothetical protein
MLKYYHNQKEIAILKQNKKNSGYYTAVPSGETGKPCPLEQSFSTVVAQEGCAACRVWATMKHPKQSPRPLDLLTIAYGISQSNRYFRLLPGRYRLTNYS